MCLRVDEAGIQPRGGCPRAEHAADAGSRNQRGDVVWNRIFDTGVAGARDIATIQHVPKREIVGKNQRGFLRLARGGGLAKRERKRGPETVLRVRIIKRPLARFRRGHRAEN